LIDESLRKPTPINPEQSAQKNTSDSKKPNSEESSRKQAKLIWQNQRRKAGSPPKESGAAPKSEAENQSTNSRVNLLLFEKLTEEEWAGVLHRLLRLRRLYGT